MSWLLPAVDSPLLLLFTAGFVWAAASFPAFSLTSINLVPPRAHAAPPAAAQDCGSSNVTNFGVAGTAGYLAPISCDNFYNYAWWVSGIHCHWHCSSSMLRPLWSSQ